jgi:hypothetical protein
LHSLFPNSVKLSEKQVFKAASWFDIACRADDKLEEVHLFERPVVGAGNAAQFLLGLRKGDVEDAFSGAGAPRQKLEAKDGSAGAGAALCEVNAVAQEAAAEDLVEALDARSSSFA